jgi:tRNA dimethylallyltransferase
MMHTLPLARILVIVGPTAGGKSAAALNAALQQPAFIINADSMQLYRDLPILTAQPEKADLSAAPHKLYSILEPQERLSAGQWLVKARAEITKALAQNHLPIVIGGTGLYIKALLQGLSPIPEVPDDIRAAAVAAQQSLGNPGFHAALAARDPEMAVCIHHMHTSRLLRAWEVLEATGKSLLHWQSLPPDGPPTDWHFEIKLIQPPREELYRRCDARFLQMIERGVLKEVQAFQSRLESGDVLATTPLTKALGFKALSQHLKGEITLEAAMIQAQTETRNYAKRQITWFRHQLPKV